MRITETTEITITVTCHPSQAEAVTEFLSAKYGRKLSSARCIALTSSDTSMMQFKVYTHEEDGAGRFSESKTAEINTSINTDISAAALILLREEMNAQSNSLSRSDIRHR
ncbi:TPA: hypothetical protein ACF334_004434 [Vibrio parahaemolyticus]